MQTFIKFQFRSDGASPFEIIKKLRELGFKPVVGDYDFKMVYGSPEEYAQHVNRLHAALKGMNVNYTLTSGNDD